MFDFSWLKEKGSERVNIAGRTLLLRDETIVSAKPSSASLWLVVFREDNRTAMLSLLCKLTLLTPTITDTGEVCVGGKQSVLISKQPLLHDSYSGTTWFVLQGL